ncbi:MAG: hypothetical protein GEU83_15085 [Pseudonocardiaceae bacterium]|nr:hypothetical protein [Pseudonocardiaceae bacterium]
MTVNLTRPPACRCARRRGCSARTTGSSPGSRRCGWVAGSGRRSGTGAAVPTCGRRAYRGSPGTGGARLRPPSAPGRRRRLPGNARPRPPTGSAAHPRRTRGRYRSRCRRS